MDVGHWLLEDEKLLTQQNTFPFFKECWLLYFHSQLLLSKSDTEPWLMIDSFETLNTNFADLDT
jgi:hypothetical protein